MKIPIALIQIENPTQEVNEEQLKGIADSFREKGQLHPIKVRPANNFSDSARNPDNYSYILASGEKRLLAAKFCEWTEIEADIVDVDNRGARELRLHENLKRFNLPWFEEVILREELHSLRQEQHGLPIRTGRPTTNPEAPKKEKQGWSIRDTAAELGVGVGPLSEDLSLARALRDDPTLRKVQDKKTAVKLARIILKRQTAEQEASRPTTLDLNQVFFGDSTYILQNFPASSFDCCITDPPWITFFEPKLRLDERTLPVFRELYRVLRPNAFLFVFCGTDDYNYYTGVNKPDQNNPTTSIHERGELEKIGFNVASTPLIWQKVNSLSRRGVRSWEYDRDFELIIVACKGSPALTTSRRLSGIKTFAITHPSKMIHPNEKPLELIENILQDCSYEGSNVVDPFGGSGVLAEAAKKMGRKFVVCERDRSAYVKICERIGVKI